MLRLDRALHLLRRRFYELGGPWYRCRLFEALGSRRYSQPALFGMDRRLAELVRQGGTFVEAGAHDGYTQSNTYYLERWQGWSGVLVEPVPQLRARCVRRRPRARVFGCALVGPDDGQTVAIRLEDLMSEIVPSGTIVDGKHDANGERVAGGVLGACDLDPRPQDARGAIEVPARTLSSVLDEAGLAEVDVIVLDLEGAELAAIAGLDRERHAARFILVETLDRGAQQPALDAALAPDYEFFEAFSPYDVLYRRRG
jgi:FkbM family methyltransferase